MRDKYLTEKMVGVCVHTLSRPHGFCVKCHREWPHLDSGFNFSTWENFGKLWTWAQEQEWFAEFFVSKLTCRETDLININKLINPDRFGKAVYEFLKGREV